MTGMQRGRGGRLAAVLLLAGIGLTVFELNSVDAARRSDPLPSLSPVPEIAQPVQTAQASMPGIGLGNNWEWQGANYESFQGFLQVLQAERYTALLFKRISVDLRHGKVTAMALLLERFHIGRWRRNMPEGAASLAPEKLLQDTADDALTAIGFANKSSDLDIPEFMIEPVVGLAQRVVHKIYRLPGDAPGSVDDVPVPEDVVQEELPEAESRAENTGLYHDVVEFVKQPHLQFLLRGDILTVKARLLAEVLKVARNDNLVVDEKSVNAFADRLVDAGVVEAEHKDRFIRKAKLAFGMKTSNRQAATSTEPLQGETPASVVTTPVPENPPTPEQAATSDNQPGVSHDIDTEVVTPDPPSRPDATQPPSVAPSAPQLSDRPVADKAPPIVQQEAKGDLLMVLETGLGVTVSTEKVDLDPVTLSVGLDPGIAARFGLGAMWLEALGPAHLGVSLVGVVGKTEAVRLTGVAGPGALNTEGSNSYIGLMPFLSIELPVSSRVNARLGGGIGVAYRSLEVLSGGIKIIDADGTAMIAQIGGGLRYALSSCADIGVDVFATYLDKIKGSGIAGAPVTFAGAWDVAAYASVRIAMGSAAESTACHVFVP